MSKEKEQENIQENIQVEDINKLNLMERMNIVINEIRIEKKGVNKFANYNYFQPEAINSKVNPLFLKYKIFPHFYTDFIDYPLEVEETTKCDPNVSPIYIKTTKHEYREIAFLVLTDILNPDIKLTYKIPIISADIKGANKMQNIGGARTYAKRYLYMEALNISDNKLDLDNGKLEDKTKKPKSDNQELQEKISEIKAMVTTLREQNIENIQIAAAIKEVYTDNGVPSAKYDGCKTIEEAQKIIDNLEKKFYKGE